MTVSHLMIGGGDIPGRGASPNTGLLGADYEVEQGRYRFKRVLAGDNSIPQLTAPLTKPGVNIKAGDYLVAVDNQEVNANESLYRYFVGTAGKPTQIKVAATRGRTR